MSWQSKDRGCISEFRRLTFRTFSLQLKKHQPVFATPISDWEYVGSVFSCEFPFWGLV